MGLKDWDQRDKGSWRKKGRKRVRNQISPIYEKN
jgi:hypothetical protein